MRSRISRTGSVGPGESDLIPTTDASGIVWKRVLAALLSLLIPGLGQVYQGRRLRGAVMVGITVSVVVVGAWVWSQDKFFVLSILVKPPVLLGLLALDLALMLFRLFSVVDAFLIPRPTGAKAAPGRGQRLQRFGTVVVVAVLLIVAAAPHVAGGYYDFQAYDLIVGVFPSQSASKVLPTAVPTETPEVAATSITEPAATSQAVVLPTAPQRPEPTLTPVPPTLTADALPPTPVPPWKPGERLNVLLLGGDAGPGRSGLRTDTIIVASIEPVSGRAALFAVPRNMVGVPLPDGPAEAFDCRCWPSLINALYGYGQKYPARFPGGNDAGATALKGAVGTLLGIRIDYYALVDLRAFVDVIDALGGVTIDVPQRVDDILSPPEPGGEFLEYDIRPGLQHLNGHEALAYSRSRAGTSDYTRMARQRCILAAIVHGADATKLLTSFPRLASVVKERVKTDIPIELLPELMRLAPSIDTRQVVSVGFNPPLYNAGWAKGGYPTPDVPLIRRTVQETFQQSPDVLKESLGLETVNQSCGWED